MKKMKIKYGSIFRDILVIWGFYLIYAIPKIFTLDIYEKSDLNVIKRCIEELDELKTMTQIFIVITVAVLVCELLIEIVTRKKRENRKEN